MPGPRRSPDYTLWAKLFITAFLVPTVGYVAIVGQNQKDGTYLAFALAGLTLLGAMWGPTNRGGDS